MNSVFLLHNQLKHSHMKTSQILAFRTLQFISFALASTAILAIVYAIVQIAIGNYHSTASREF